MHLPSSNCKCSLYFLRVVPLLQRLMPLCCCTRGLLHNEGCLLDASVCANLFFFSAPEGNKAPRDNLPAATLAEAARFCAQAF
jgi:hypothetical protein